MGDLGLCFADGLAEFLEMVAGDVGVKVMAGLGLALRVGQFGVAAVCSGLEAQGRC